MDRRILSRIGVVAAGALVAPLLTSTTSLAVTPPAPPPPPHPAVESPAPIMVSRLAGETRIGTAVAVSQEMFDNDDSSTANDASVVVLARADEYADALTGGPLAAALGGPLLLSDPAAIDPAVLAEIQRLDPQEVVMIGGSGALSLAVENAIEAQGYTTRRLFGNDRFQTAASIAEELTGGETGGTVVLVEGMNPDPLRGWPDGVSVGAYAGYMGWPILPVVRDSVPATIQTELTALSPDEIVIVGGTAAVSQAVEDAVTPAEDEPGPTVRRLAGDDRYETSAAIYDEAVTQGLSPVTKWLATGSRFPDALTGGATAARFGQSLLLVPGDAIAAATGVMTRLTATFDLMEDVFLLGGTAAISAASEQAVEDAVMPATLPAADFCLTVLHNNDSESQLIDAGSGLEDFGGAARFASRLLTERARGPLFNDGCDTVGVLTVTSGDNFLAGPEFNASQDHGVPYYDSMLLDYLNYDAVDLGNHDFDFGPQVTANLIAGMSASDGAKFLSANLEFTGSPLEPYVGDKLLPSTTVTMGSHTIGVIGITPPYLRQISSPGDDIVINGTDVNGDTDLAAVADIINDQATSLQTNDGADIIVVISHLQDLDNDKALVPMLDDVDIVVAGGGDEVLATPGELLVPGDETVIADSYPTWVGDVPVVTTSGNYKYVGRLVSRFDTQGVLVDVDEQNSRMVRVAGGDMPDAVAPNTWVKTHIVDPVAAYVEDLATNVIATSNVDLDGTRAHVRTQETNVGDLLADSMVATGQSKAAEFGLDDTATFVALTNGGGIRNDSVIAAGDVTELDTFDIAPFSNFIVVFENVTVSQLDALLEHAYEMPFDQAGQFAQVGNLLVDVDRTAPVGSRVSNIRTADGAALADGFSLATINFLADGGDDYPFADEGLTSYTSVGVTYQQGLASYITGLGTITATGYPDMGGYAAIADPPTNAQRIVFTDLP